MGRKLIYLPGGVRKLDVGLCNVIGHCRPRPWVRPRNSSFSTAFSTHIGFHASIAHGSLAGTHPNPPGSSLRAHSQASASARGQLIISSWCQPRDERLLMHCGQAPCSRSVWTGPWSSSRATQGSTGLAVSPSQHSLAHLHMGSRLRWSCDGYLRRALWSASNRATSLIEEGFPSLRPRFLAFSALNVSKAPGQTWQNQSSRAWPCQPHDPHVASPWFSLYRVGIFMGEPSELDVPPIAGTQWLLTSLVHMSKRWRKWPPSQLDALAQRTLTLRE
jgi:hypothetical protein